MANRVKVILKADCYVGGQLRKEGEEVEVREELADQFGDVVKSKPASKDPDDKK